MQTLFTRPKMGQGRFLCLLLGLRSLAISYRTGIRSLNFLKSIFMDIKYLPNTLPKFLQVLFQGEYVAYKSMYKGCIE